MKAWKFVILIGGIVGLAGFFLPFVSYGSADGKVTGTVSAYQVVKGIDDAREIIGDPEALGASHEDTKKIAKFFNEELAAFRGALVAFFAPAALLALLGAIAASRNRLGRIGGLLASALGCLSAGVWLLFYQVTQQEHDASSSLGIGLWLLLVAGVAGIAGGLGATFLPDRGDA